ncbi:MAG TPA: acetate uptake transporter [Ktedonobacteraceae bacterium]|nr:acetate uptake transporter [Ktedonobacteraceae bacterium]
MEQRFTTHEPPPLPMETIPVASPAPLGLSVLAFATAILGCFFTGLIIPFQAVTVRGAVGATFLIAGPLLILAGMWEFRKNSLMTATAFTAYGGFLAILGLVFMPNFGITAALGGNLNLLLGLLFLCWTIFTVVMCIGAFETNMALLPTLGLLFLAFLFLTIGQLSGANSVLIKVGGWLAIVCAIVSWLASIASMLGIASPRGRFRFPLGRRMAVVE